MAATRLSPRFVSNHQAAGPLRGFKPCGDLLPIESKPVRCAVFVSFISAEGRNDAQVDVEMRRRGFEV
jgi:hypothetical protein